VLKAEIIDENSQNSILSAENMSESMDTFVNENSMDASSSASMLTPTPLELMMQKNAENSFAPTMNQSGLLNLASTSPMTVVDLRVKQEEDLSVQMQELVNPTMNESSGSAFIQQFGESKVGDLKVQINDVSMFNAQTSAMANSPEVMLGNSLMGSKTMSTDQQPQLEQQSSVFNAPSIMTEAGTATSLNHMLSFPSATSNILATSPTNAPLTSDVLLNSQSLNPLNSSPTLMAGKTVTDSDIIMNPAISPSMMCTNAPNESSNLIASNVEPMITTTSQPASDSLLNNLMQPMSIKQSDAAVKNMILNAAAEILSSEPHSITQETTSNCLMSLNSEASVQQSQCGSPPSITNILTHTDSTSSVVVLAGNNKLIQNVVEAAIVQNASDIIQNHVVAAESCQMGTSTYSSNTSMVNVQPTTTAAAAANLSPVQQSLLSNIQQEIIETIKSNEMQTPMEMVQKQRKISEPMTNSGAATQKTQQQQIGTNVVTPTTAHPATTTGVFPQELTSMSDHDLISYINPSCFDQV